jgi:DNA-binding NarL/FixJ family response regulator
METVGTVKKLEINSKISSFGISKYVFEVVVIEDNHLTNTILCKALDSTINSIYNLKQIPVKFTSYQNGNEFLTYLDSRELSASKLIVFSDYHLEENMNGGKILRSIKQKFADAIVVIMSDSPNKQIPIDTVNMGAHCFLPKDNKTPVICSELLFKMIN